jgi:hypothetical protein
MSTIDNLFALPAPLGLLKTLIRPQRSLFFTILSSVLIQALVLVSILAPSALGGRPSEQAPRDMEVPIFSLSSQSQFTTESYISNSHYRVVIASLNLSTLGDERINSVLLNLPELTWAIPQGCGLKCTFYFEYSAPGLECRDIVPVGPLDPTNPVIYRANSSVYPLNLTEPPSPQNIDAPYDLSINYTEMTNVWSYVTLPHPAPFSREAGTYCRFYQATYNASFELYSNSSTQQASTSIISHGGYLSQGKTAAATPVYGNWEGLASWAICYAFARAFLGGSGIYEAKDIPKANPVLASVFSMNASTGSFELAVSNLSQTLMDLFSNLTLGLISTRGGKDMIIANGTTWDGSTVWIYTTWILWAAYLPALILAVAVALCGLYTIHESGIAMDDKFSSFLLATQNVKVHELCGKAANFEELERIQLIHQKRGTFVVVDSGLESPN